MSVVSAYEGLLTNAEVFNILSHGKKGKRSGKVEKKQENIEDKVQRYLQSNTHGVTTISVIKEISQSLTRLRLGLTDAETLMLINHLPTSAVEIHLVR